MAAASLLSAGVVAVGLATPAGADFTTTATVNVGGTPDGVGVDTSTGTVYEANNFGSVMEINGTTVANTINIPGQLEGVAVDSTTHTAYVVDASQAALHEVVGTTVTATVSIPNAEGVPAVDPSTHLAYVNDVSDNRLYEVNGSAVAGFVPVGSGPNGEIGLDPSTHDIYTANSGSDNVSIVNGGSVIATVPVGSEPSGVAVDPTTHIAYVANFGSNSVSEIYGSSVIATVSVGNEPLYPTVDPTTHRVYVTSFGNRKVYQLLGDAVVGSTSVQTHPSAIAVNPGSHMLYVTNQGSNTMSELTIPHPRGAGWGYAQVQNGVMSTTYQGNSQGLSNTVTTLAVGQYQVEFPGLGGLGTNGGTVQVSVMSNGGGGAGYCNSGGWSQSAGNVFATVECYKGGVLTNGSFDIVYTDPADSGSPVMTYLWANSPSASSYTPSLYYQYSSSGSPDSITRTSAGTYTVTAPGLSMGDGTVAVTAYSTTNQCRVGSWSGDEVNIDCTSSPSGTPADTAFEMTWVNGASLLGVAGHKFAYLWANDPGTASPYSPPSAYADNSSGGAITIRRVSTGDWNVALKGVAVSTHGTVVVSAYGSTAAECGWGSLSGSGTTETANVQCFSTLGVPLNTTFTLQFMR